MQIIEVSPGRCRARTVESGRFPAPVAGTPAAVHPLGSQLGADHMHAASLPSDPDAEPATTACIDLTCYRPAGGACAAFEARLRELVVELGGRARLVIATRAARTVPAGVYLSPAVPTLVVMADGRVLAQAVGELPRRELRALIEDALGKRR
jgi:hypothetical protein